MCKRERLVCVATEEPDNVVYKHALLLWKHLLLVHTSLQVFLVCVSQGLPKFWCQVGVVSSVNHVELIWYIIYSLGIAAHYAANMFPWQPIGDFPR